MRTLNPPFAAMPLRLLPYHQVISDLNERLAAGSVKFSGFGKYSQKKVRTTLTRERDIRKLIIQSDALPSSLCFEVHCSIALIGGIHSSCCSKGCPGCMRPR